MHVFAVELRIFKSYGEEHPTYTYVVSFVHHNHSRVLPVRCSGPVNIKIIGRGATRRHLYFVIFLCFLHNHSRAIHVLTVELQVFNS